MSVRCRAKIGFTGGASSGTPVASGGGDIGVGACECIDRVNTPPEAGPIAENLCLDPSVEASTDLSELTDPNTWYTHPWAVDTKGIVPGYRIATDDARTGSQSIRSGGLHFAPADMIIPVAESDPGLFTRQLVSAPCKPGDTITMRFWYKITIFDGPDLGGEGEAGCHVVFFDALGSSLGGELDLTGGRVRDSWTQVESVFTAPTFAAWVQARFVPPSLSTPNFPVETQFGWFDDFELYVESIAL